MDNNYIDYEKITDDLCQLGYNAILRFNVSLASKLQDGTRRHFHSEFSYRGDKYTNQNISRSIRRHFDYFLSIENTKMNDNGVKEFIMIRIQDILYVREQFEKAVKWFRGEEFSNLFARSKDKLVMLGKVEPISILGLSMDKSLLLEPVILTYEDHQTTGIRLYLASKDNYVDMTVDKFMGVVYLLSSINMYESAQLLLNYLQRPELGTGVFTFNKNQDEVDEYGGGINNVSARKIAPNKTKKSFFDKVDEL